LLSKGAAKEILNKKGRLAKELAHSPHTMSSFLSESERARQSKRSPRKEKLSRVSWTVVPNFIELQLWLLLGAESRHYHSQAATAQ